MFVSRRKPTATESDLVWHISHLERLTAIKLLGSDSDTRSGGFYVTVFGWCTEDAQCSDQCSCAPCSNLKSASYTLKVSGEMDYDYSRDSIDYLDPCTSDGTCTSTCSYTSSTSSDHHNRNKLSRSQIIGIVFGCFGFLLLLAVGVYLVRVQLSKQVGVVSLILHVMKSSVSCLSSFLLPFYLVTQASCSPFSSLVVCLFL